MKNQMWISVNERLPDEGVHILISIPDGVTYGWFNGCYFVQDISHNSKRLRVVDAWMPLPEPYREKGD